MGLFEKVAQPGVVDRMGGPASDGYIIGWVPGEITNIDDPEGLGRVRVRSDLIQQDVDLPNMSDGWVWVSEPFVLNATPGGSHTPLEVGAQVALLPMMGNPGQMLVIGCLPSRVDKPHPDLNRHKKTYGSATYGDVFEFYNDKDASRLFARPHGTIEHISGEGDITLQTKKEGRLQIKQDGTTKIENPSSFTMLTPEGTVMQRSKEGAQSVLSKDGTVQITSQFSSALTLDKGEGKLKGPASQISQLLGGAKKVLSGHLGIGKRVLGQLRGVAKQVGSLTGSDGLTDLIDEAGGYLDHLGTSLSGNIDQGIGILNDLSKVSVAELGQRFLPQIESALKLDLDKVVPLAEKALSVYATVGGGGVALELAKHLPTALGVNIKPEAIAPLLDGLSHAPKLQLQTLIDHVLPEGMKQIEGLVGLGLHTEIAPLNRGITKPLDPREGNSSLQAGTEALGRSDLIDAFFRPFEDDELEEFNALYNKGAEPVENTRYALFINSLRHRSESIWSALSTEAKEVTKPESIAAAIANESELDSPLEVLLGHASKTVIQSVQGSATKMAPLLKSASQVKDILGGIRSGDRSIVQLALDELGKDPKFANLAEDAEAVLNNPSAFLTKALSSVEKELSPVLEQGMKGVSKLINGLPANIESAAVRAVGGPLGEYVEAATSIGAAGATMKVGKAAAALVSPKGMNQVFAGIGSAGIKTPWGEFGLGAGGGSFLSQAQMALKVAQGVGQSAGLLLHPKKGVSLSSFHHPAGVDEKDSDDTGKPNAFDWKNESARVAVSDDQVLIESVAANGAARHQIRVNAAGVFINNVLITDWISNLEYRLAALEAAQIVLPQPPS